MSEKLRGGSRIFRTLVKNVVTEHRGGGGGGGGAPSEVICVQFYEKNVTWKMTVSPNVRARQHA
jgi:hypothetical protein